LAHPLAKRGVESHRQNATKTDSEDNGKKQAYEHRIIPLEDLTLSVIARTVTECGVHPQFKHLTCA